MKINQDQLLLAMARAQITDGDLCVKSGIAKPTLVTLKSGKRQPRPATVGKLAAALGVDPTEIIEREGI